jgi:cation:H+ antiporter
VSVVLLVAGLVLVVAGAELFFAGLLAAAARFGISPFVLTVVVSGFELENLAAGIAANAKGLSNAAAGTFLGGTTFLALAVPGLAAVASPLRARLPRRVLAWTAASPLPLLGLAADGELARWEGGVLVAWFVVAIVGIARSGRGLVGTGTPERPRFPLVRLVGGLALLTVAGDLLGRGIERVVEGFGISQSLLGNTAIAASVEAEEVGRVVTPARHGRGDVALGNVVGTIAHFAAFNAGVIALVRPIELDHDSRVLHLPVAAAAPVLLAVLLLVRDGVGRALGLGLLTLYAAYVAAAILLGA